MIWFLLLCTLSVSGAQFEDVRFTPTYLYDRLTSVLKAISRLIDFYKHEYRHMNLDGLFGLRVVEGELFNQVFQMNNNKKLFYKEMRTAWHEMQQIFLNVTRLWKSDNSSPLLFVIKRAWMPMYIYSPIYNRLMWKKSVQKPSTIEIISEDISDKCIAELYSGSQNRMCNVTNYCLNTMLLTKGLFGYQITHQVLYILLVKRLYCQLKVTESLQKIQKNMDLETLKKTFCSNIYHEVRQLIHHFNYTIPDDFQDLLMEQIWVCGGAGFLHIADLHLLDLILSWQDKTTGCYYSKDDRQQSSKRKLLEEVTLQKGCLAHKSAVAAGALSVYLHLLTSSEHIVATGLPDYAASVFAEHERRQRMHLPSLLQDVSSTKVVAAIPPPPRAVRPIELKLDRPYPLNFLKESGNIAQMSQDVDEETSMSPGRIFLLYLCACSVLFTFVCLLRRPRWCCYFCYSLQSWRWKNEV